LDGWLNYAKWPILQDAIFGKHHYSGPFFASLGKVEECPYGGHSSPCNCAFEEDSHGVGANKEEACTEHRSPTGAGRRMVADLCLQAIDNSDLVFAWIESVDCYGTLIELGYAKALKKTIVLSGPRRFRDLWFADAATNNCCQRLGGISAKEALRAYLYQAELRIAKQWTK
jgi:hypothetical protein